MRIPNYQDRTPGGGKLLGTCAALEERTGIPANAWRVATIVTLCIWFKLTIAFYCIAAIAFKLGKR
jgi:phage shock protein PspC (stress-responsive transcriptional regulator)